jgi:hypothetical protein
VGFRLFVAHLGALIETAQAGSFYGRDVHKHVLAAVVGLNKSVPLSRVKPLHCTRCHVSTPLLKHGDNLRSVAGRAARKKAPALAEVSASTYRHPNQTRPKPTAMMPAP